MYHVNVIFLDRSNTLTVPKEYTYVSYWPASAGDLLVVEVNGAPKLVEVRSCKQADKIKSPMKLKMIRGFVDEQAYKRRQKQEATLTALQFEFEQQFNEYVQSQAMHSVLGKNPELLAMYNEIQALKTALEN